MLENSRSDVPAGRLPGTSLSPSFVPAQRPAQGHPLSDGRKSAKFGPRISILKNIYILSLALYIYAYIYI